MQPDIQELVKQMTLEEIASLCSGADFWQTKPLERRLNIPAITMADGPHGLRKQVESADHLGLHNSMPAHDLEALNELLVQSGLLYAERSAAIESGEPVATP